MAQELEKSVSNVHGKNNNGIKYIWSKRLLWIGGGVGSVLGFFAAYAAYQHRPPGTVPGGYADDPLLMALLWFSWFAVAFGPFAIVAFIVRFVVKR